MATSSKVRFNLETLAEQALHAVDLRIVHAKTQLDSHHDPDALAVLEAEWRTRQESKVASLATQLEQGDVSNHQLAQFSIDPMPTPGDKAEQRRDQDRYDSLLVRRQEVQAKATSLVPDEDGSITLTKTQLREFFDL